MAEIIDYGKEKAIYYDDRKKAPYSFDDFKDELKKIITNSDNICNLPIFDDWAKILYYPNMLGIHFADVFDLVKNKKVEISHIIPKDMAELKTFLEQKIAKECKGIITTMKTPPPFNLDDSNKILEMIVEILDPNSPFETQVTIHDDKFEMIILTI